MNPESTAIFPKLSPLEGHLWARSGKHVGRRYSIAKVEQMIGRSPSCDIEVEDERVSQLHAKVVTVDGRHHIYDLGSTNGTFVNDQRVDEAELRDGDFVQVGETIFEYLCNEERALTITLRGSQDSIVPSALREGAKQLLQRQRVTGDEAPTPPSGTPIPGRSHAGSSPDGQGAQGGQSYAGQGYGAQPYAGQGYAGQGLQLPSLASGRPISPPPQPPQQPLPQVSMQHYGTPQQVHGMPGMPVPYVGPDGAGMYPPAPPMYPPSIHVAAGGDEDGESQLSIPDMIDKVKAIIGAFLPYWPSVTAMLVLGIAAGVGSLKLMPPTKRAMFQMSIHTNQSENPVQNFTRTNMQFFRNAQENFVRPEVIRRTLTALGYTDLSDSAVKDVQEKLEFSRMGGGVPGHPMNTNSNTYQGAYKGKRGDEVLRYLDKHLRVYLESEVEKTLKIIQVEADFLAKQVAEGQEELNRTEWELTEFKRKNIDALPETARTMYAQAITLSTRQREIEQEAARYAIALDHSRKKVLFENPLEESQIQEVRPYAQAIVAKRQELANAQAQGKGPLHPDVLRIAQELRDLEAMEQEAVSKNARTSVKNVNPSYRLAVGEERENEKAVDVTRTHAAQLQRDLDDLYSKLADLPEREATFLSLTRAFENARETHGRLLSQEKTAKLQLELERASSSARYDIIVPPQLEVVSSFKETAKRGAIGGVFFAMLAVLRALYKVGMGFLATLKRKQDEARNVKALVPVGPSGLAPPNPPRV